MKISLHLFSKSFTLSLNKKNIFVSVLLPVPALGLWLLTRTWLAPGQHLRLLVSDPGILRKPTILNQDQIRHSGVHLPHLLVCGAVRLVGNGPAQRGAVPTLRGTGTRAPPPAQRQADTP